ncbi:RNA polymerase sigma factor [Pedobacter lusitanus]|uniref:RNA polymerase sigma factor n=2 Tax=Pedobacter lusitanus TaxID=1503925 RepID=A0A0D0GTU9_9SPHI|nr:RNA polymerase sigma factor [Pedobacter lusitanus]
MKEQELIPHLFRSEFRKITAVLSKIFGIAHLEIAEDIASETFLLAAESWPFKGIPENPVGWLYKVAKNKARNYLTRQQLFTDKVAIQIGNSVNEVNEELETEWSDQHINDSQLQMLFAICHPAISAEAQIGLALRILCGFGIDEIANAFLTAKETINKRLFRAKEKLRTEKVKIEFPAGAEINRRLTTVLTTLYLLFNEGYYSESQDAILREDFCLEAMRLTYMLIANEQTNLPAVNALLALMCFHSSRFEARKDSNGAIILYQDQNEELWNDELISKGVYFLNQASRGNEITKYHLEAGIAYWQTIKTETQEKWENVLHFYNQLLIIEYSPAAALNRAYVISKVNGNEAGITATEKLNLTDNHYYYMLLGELYKDINIQRAKDNFNKAFSLAKTETEKKIIQIQSSRLELDIE